MSQKRPEKYEHDVSNLNKDDGEEKKSGRSSSKMGEKQKKFE